LPDCHRDAAAVSNFNKLCYEIAANGIGGDS